MEGLVKMGSGKDEGVGEDEGLARMERLVRFGGLVRMVRMEGPVMCLASSHSLSMRAGVSACAA